MNNLSKLLNAASFSAAKHAGQTRKGERAEPYINHPIEVANLLANVGGIDDTDILIAALLHDTIEDCGVTAEEISKLFGKRVAGFVVELTDDMTLPKATRKQKQIEHAPHLTPEAKQIKLADKISNIHDITVNPPADWSLDRRREYLEWGTAVVAGLRGANRDLESKFDEIVAAARSSIV